MSARPQKHQQQGVKELEDIIKPSAKPTTTAKQEDIVEQQTAAMLESPAWAKLREEMNENAVEKIRALSPKDSYTIQVAGQARTFTRSKIKARQFKELEALRTQLATELKEKDPHSNLTQVEIYQKCAEYYLGMTEEEFDECDYETLKQVLDACTVRTTMGTASPN